MKNPTAPLLRTLVAALAAAAAPCLSQAADFALIMGVGNYQRSSANLPGIDKDVAIARTIAQSMGVQPGNIRELTDGQVTRDGVMGALREMESRLQPGDRAFIYYSGHGAQVPNSGGGGSKCTEGMFVHDMKLYEDFELERSLARIAERAGQLVMFNDSCFSGGAATKATRTATAVPKFFKASSNDADYNCGDAVNMKGAARNLLVGAARKGNNFVYVAAAADNEVAMATSNGSAATLAWQACLRDPATDRNHSGGLSAEELEACAQREVTRMGHKQTITIVGNKQLTMSFAAAGPGAGGGGGGGSGGGSGGAAPRPDAARETLEDIRQSAAPGFNVELRANTQLKIEKDMLDMSITSNRSGYLYVLHVGSDGSTFDLLFPNDKDASNRIQAGSPVRLPRADWAITAGGPPGTSYIMAIVSDTQKSLRSFTNKAGPFRTMPSTGPAVRNLIVESVGVGAPSGSGQYGASAVIGVREYR